MRRAFCASAVALLLSGCDDLIASRGPLTEVLFADGGLSVTAPEGLCFDTASVAADFALLANCAQFGFPSGALKVPALVVLAIADRTTSEDVSDWLVREGEVQSEIETDGTFTWVSVSGAPIDPMLSDQFWRASGPVGNHQLGLVLYVPETAQMSQMEASEILRALFENSRADAMIETASLDPILTE